jgi:ABC-type multidrug transport system fused ATPase/permease subunit
MVPRADALGIIKTTNMYQSCYVLALSMGRWMICMYEPQCSPLTSVRVNIFNVIIVSATLALVITTPGMTGSQAGFILGFASRVVDDLHNVLYDLRNYDLDGVKLERLAEYRNLDTEDIPALIGSKEMAETTNDPMVTALADWPSKGAIQVTDLAARYAPDMPEILHDVSFSCDGGERVGIVGASGGGKSTLAKALFSFVEVTKGRIEIDGKGVFNQIPR